MTRFESKHNRGRVDGAANAALLWGRIGEQTPQHRVGVQTPQNRVGVQTPQYWVGSARARGRVACFHAMVISWMTLGTLACSRIPPGRSAIDSVRVINAKNVGGGDIEDKLATQATPKFLFLFQGVAYDYTVYDDAVLQRDMARVERVYQAHGFFDAHARVAHVRQVKKDHVQVEIVVDEGPPTRNRNITVVGTEELPADVREATLKSARSSLPLHANFDEQKFKDTEAAVKKALTDRGYAWAKVNSDAEVDIGEHVADYGFKVTPGPRAKFGSVTITGLDPDAAGPRKQEIPEGPLYRAINITPGSEYSTAEIDAATQALLDLEVFTAVDIEPSLPEPPPPDHVVPLAVKVEPARLRQITLGGGIEIDSIKTDLHAVTGWEDHNFLGNLRDFQVTFQPGVVLYPIRIDSFKGPLKPLPEERLRLSLTQPGFIEARTTGFVRPQLNVFPLLVTVDPPSDAPVVGYVETKLPLGVEHTFWNTLYTALDYTFQVESPFPYIQSLDPDLRTVVLSFPELVTHLDFRDDQVRPHAGIYVGNTLQVAGGIFGGNATDVRIQPEVRTYLPIKHGVTFATRASVGLLFASNYAQSWPDELRGSPSTLMNNTMPVAGPTVSRATLAHDEQIMYFRGLFSGGPTSNRGYPLLGVAPHAIVPFLNPQTASTQVQYSCNPSTIQGLLADTNNQASQDQAQKLVQQCYLPVGGFTLWEFQNEVRFDISGPLSAAVFCDMSDVSPRETDFRFSYLHLSCGVGAAYDTPVGPIRLDIGYRIPPLQVLGQSDEAEAFKNDPLNGRQPTILGLPIALAVGIGQAY